MTYKQTEKQQNKYGEKNNSNFKQQTGKIAHELT